MDDEDELVEGVTVGEYFQLSARDESTLTPQEQEKVRRGSAAVVEISKMGKEAVNSISERFTANMRPISPPLDEYAKYERQLGIPRVPDMDFTPAWQEPIESMAENMKLVAEATSATNIQVRASEAAAQKRADEAEAAARKRDEEAEARAEADRVVARKRDRDSKVIAWLTLAAAILVPIGILVFGG